MTVINYRIEISLLKAGNLSVNLMECFLERERRAFEFFNKVRNFTAIIWSLSAYLEDRLLDFGYGGYVLARERLHLI